MFQWLMKVVKAQEIITSQVSMVIIQNYIS